MSYNSDNGPDKGTGQFHSVKGNINETVSPPQMVMKPTLTFLNAGAARLATPPVRKTGNETVRQSTDEEKPNIILLAPKVLLKVSGTASPAKRTLCLAL